MEPERNRFPTWVIAVLLAVIAGGHRYLLEAVTGMPGVFGVLTLFSLTFQTVAIGILINIWAAISTRRPFTRLMFANLFGGLVLGVPWFCGRPVLRDWPSRTEEFIEVFLGAVLVFVVLYVIALAIRILLLVFGMQIESGSGNQPDGYLTLRKQIKLLGGVFIAIAVFVTGGWLVAAISMIRESVEMGVGLLLVFVGLPIASFIFGGMTLTVAWIFLSESVGRRIVGLSLAIVVFIVVSLVLILPVLLNWGVIQIQDQVRTFVLSLPLLVAFAEAVVFYGFTWMRANGVRLKRT